MLEELAEFVEPLLDSEPFVPLVPFVPLALLEPEDELFEFVWLSCECWVPLWVGEVEKPLG